MDKRLDDLIQNLLEIDPNKRLNWNQYFSHRFFKNKFWNILENSTNSK